MEATLLAYDYSKNPSYCKLIAPILDPQTSTTLQYSQVASSFNNNLTSDSAFISPATTPTTRYILNRESVRSTLFEGGFSRWTPDLSTSVSAHNVTIRATVTGNTGHTPDFQPGGSQTAVPTATSGQYLRRKTTLRKSLTSATSLNTLITDITDTVRSQGSTNSSVLLAEGNHGNHHSRNGVGSSTLRLAAIVCGSLAGVAGLAIAVICVAFRCLVKHQRERPWRRRSNDSDVTMGSSSETRSVGSYSADSIKMSRTDRSVENCTADSLRISRTGSSVDTSSADSLKMSRTGRSSGKLTEIDSCRTSGKESANFDSINAVNPVQKSRTLLNDTYRAGSRHLKEEINKEVILFRRKNVHCGADFRDGKFQCSEKAEDITKTKLDAPKRDEAECNKANISSLPREKSGNCAIAIQTVSSTRQAVEDVIFRCVVVEKANAAEDGAPGICSDTGGDEASKQSYSLLLRSGGKTYSSMLQVQQQIEAMENQRRNLSSAAGQYPPACTLPRVAIRSSYDAGDEMGVTTAKLDQYQEPCPAASQYPPDSISPNMVIRRLAAQNEMRAAAPRFRQYQEGSSCNDGPPGSPQFKNWHVHAPIQNHAQVQHLTQVQNLTPVENLTPVQNLAAVQKNTPNKNPEICQIQTPDQRVEMHNAPGENQNQYNVYFQGNKSSIPESERKYIQITSDSMEPYSKKDTPHYHRFQRESEMHQDFPGVKTNKPYTSQKITPGPADSTIRDAEAAQHVDKTDFSGCDPRIHSRTGDRCNFRNLTPKGTSQRQHSEGYNQKQSKPLRSRKHFKISQTASNHDPNSTLMVPKKQSHKDSWRIHNNKRQDHYSSNESWTSENPHYQEGSITFQNNKQPDQYSSNGVFTPDNPPYQEERSRFENNKRPDHYYGTDLETPEKPYGQKERRFQSNKRPDHYFSNVSGTSQVPTCHDEEDSRNVQSRNRPNHLVAAEGNQGYLDITDGSSPSPSQAQRINGTCAQSSESSQVFVRVCEQTSRQKTPVYANSREPTDNVVCFDVYTNKEISQKETNTPRVTMSSIPTPSQTPSNSRSDSPDPRYLQPENGSRIVSEANQMALRHDIEHVWQKLLKFQRRIDHEIEEESRRSDGNSSCLSDN